MQACQSLWNTNWAVYELVTSLGYNSVPPILQMGVPGLTETNDSSENDDSYKAYYT